MEPFQVGEIVMGQFEGKKLWPCILIKLKTNNDHKWKVERIGDFTQTTLSKEKLIKFQSASIPQEMFEDKNFARAYEDAVQMTKEFYYNDHIAVDMSESNTVLVKYKLNDESKSGEQELIVDILTYLTKLSQKLISYQRSKRRKYSTGKYYQWTMEEIKGLINMCKFLKTQPYSVDFIETTHLGSLLYFILNNLDPTNEGYLQCISSIEELIEYIKKCIV